MPPCGTPASMPAQWPAPITAADSRVQPSTSVASCMTRASIPTGAAPVNPPDSAIARSEEHTSELQSLMRISYAVFCLKKQIQHSDIHSAHIQLCAPTHHRTTIHFPTGLRICYPIL